MDWVMGTIPRFNNELSRWRKECGGDGVGGKYKSSGRPLLSQIISEHLVIVAHCGSKITSLPTLRASSSLSLTSPMQSRQRRPREYCLPEDIWKLKSTRLLDAELSAHQRITTHQSNLPAVNYMIPLLFDMCWGVILSILPFKRPSS